MEAFYRTHAYLVEHTNAPVRRDLMDEIDWNDRLIGIKGTRGVGKTTFLLQYAKEKFGTDRSCLFINMNNFYFSGHGIVEFAAEAGIPEGVFNVITGPGSSVGEALGLHPGVDVVSFTGSTEVGRRFLEYAARSNLKRIVLELGGKSPFVVLDDVADYAAVAAQAAAAFWNMGENCTANSRIIVPRKRKDAFTEALLAELENWRIGDPLDPENNLGSIVSEGQFRTIMGYIEKGKAEGGHVLTGGAPLAIGSGLFIPPTIFDGVTPDMAIVREEIFGPVTAILPADSDEEAVGLANATAYGLQATLFTEDVTKAHKYARALKAGTVSVNCFSEGDNTTPFGGYKLSGFGGKDKGRESHDQYTETKTIFLNLDR
mgnify:CR=1 FL=1